MTSRGEADNRHSVLSVGKRWIRLLSSALCKECFTPAVKCVSVLRSVASRTASLNIGDTAVLDKLRSRLHALSSDGHTILFEETQVLSSTRPYVARLQKVAIELTRTTALA